MKLSGLPARAKTFVTDVTDFPVLPTAATLWERFQQDRLGLTASSLTFTTTLALVPFFAVVLSVFTAFPVFAQMREALEQWLASSVIPASIARNVLDYLTQFAGKASELGLVGFAVLTFTAVSLVLTIDQTLNQIWRVTVKRPLGQRVLVYWAALTLGPLVLGGSLAITSYVVSHSRGLIPVLPGGINLALDTLQAALETLAIIAYKQPVTMREISFFRGTQSSYIMKQLLEAELVTIAGRKKLPGNPLLYETSPRFLETFGLKGLEELPSMSEIHDLTKNG